MGQSYRIKTDIGVNKTINVDLEQDFEFLEILSLKIQQSDVYTRNCADYGVVVGRITANNGFGLPNARVSIFIPIESVDESNPIISSIYPYKSPTDKNSDGYRYNLLPYEKSYSTHAATGTLPSRLDALTGSTPVEIYDKYYKYTAKTNESGDYMIMGAPLGAQTVFMDLDLSDIGEFSLTPQDLIRMGKATEAQVAGANFKTSPDLNSLPQIVSLSKTIEVSPLWGDPTICQIAINRIDFDLRDDFNINIEPTATFMGSVISTLDKYRVKNNAKPKDDMGNLCGLIAGPGQILAIRQTINQDSNGNPVLEQYQLEQSGNIIDGTGSWITELPMNLEYVITNEFGEKVVSHDPTIGIPTKAKYRFKVKWSQSSAVNEQTKRPYHLVPNVREYGWYNDNLDPNTHSTSTIVKKQLASSYYFGLDWTGYTQGFDSTTTPTDIDLLNSKINCEDTFYLFEFNRVYTIASLISEYKKGAKGRFIGIKEIDSSDCETTANKFPTNDGFRNFDFLFFLFSILMQIIQLIGIPLLVIYEFIAFLWNNFAVVMLVLLTALMFDQAIQNFTAAGVAFPAIGLIVMHIIFGVLFLIAGIFMISNFTKITKYRFGRIKLPMITYPDCQACECDPETTDQDSGANASSVLTQFSNPGLYYDNFETYIKKDFNSSDDDTSVWSLEFSQAMAGRVDNKKKNDIYKTTMSQILRLPDTTNFLGTPKKSFSSSGDLPMGERINVFNSRKKYFDGLNRISVSFDYKSNIGKTHYDNTLSILTNTKLPSGTLMTFVNPTGTTDTNFLYTASTANGPTNGISGTSIHGPTSINLTYADPSNQTQGLTQQYTLYTGTTLTKYDFPADLEYYQVITAFTITEVAQIWNITNSNLLPGILMSDTGFAYNVNTATGWHARSFRHYYVNKIFADFSGQTITIIQRGVDPYSPLYQNQYGIGKILGLQHENDYIITASTRLNIPIQPITSGGLAIQQHNNQNNIFYPSYFFTPGINGSVTSGQQFSSYTTSNVGYYSAFDANHLNNVPASNNVYWNGLRGVVSTTSNSMYQSNPGAQWYDLSEDLSGVGYLYMHFDPGGGGGTYYAPTLYPTFTATPLSITSNVKNVLRTDRLPTSNYPDGSGWDSNAAVLQQNLGFTTFVITVNGDSFVSNPYSTGADVVTADIEGQVYNSNVIESLSSCQTMVGLDCYSGYSGTFGITKGCQATDSVENGCYILMNEPLKNLQKDINAFEEWGYRFRFFYGLCRGVLAQSFVNNWVNGTLYAFPIQVDTYYNSQNKPEPPVFAQQLVYFDDVSNNFYFRSSPYYVNETQPFRGAPRSDNNPLNNRELLFPTTIINLGIKASFYQEIIFDPSARAYIMNTLAPTSFSDTSDLVNLFVISRIANSSFLTELISFGNNGLDKLFSRPQKRVDGDFAQSISINSEYGVVPFSQEFYQSDGTNNSPVAVYGGNGNPTIGIFFSSTTENLQDKDFITPGIIDFRPAANVNAITYPYGIFSQLVPFYKWGYDKNSTNTIFGDEQNTWKTTTTEIMSMNYQSLSRRALANEYFISPNTQIGDIYERGYIFNINGTGGYEANYVPPYNYFLVGAPFHFYFGLVKGQSAFDKFKTKYSING
jgi:hypothetical protein